MPQLQPPDQPLSPGTPTPMSPPTPPAPVATRRRARPRPTFSSLFANYGLLILTVVFIGLFSFLLPRTFPTLLTARSILNDKAVVAMTALASMVVIAIGEFDLSVGYLVGLCHILAIILQVKLGLPWPLVVGLVLLAGAAVGVVNGLLVHVAKISSFIATLGVGTILYGISNWITDGRQIVGVLDEGFIAINATDVFGVPAPTIYVALIAVALWVAFEYLPLGRYAYALGSNARAAELTGIPRGRYVVGGFMAAGLLTAVGGVVLASRFQVGQSNIGPEFMLPSFVGALLGATTVRPGRVNVWGTIIAVLILAVGISGIQQMGGKFYVEPLFNGATLILAVGLAGYAARRRMRLNQAGQSV